MFPAYPYFSHAIIGRWTSSKPLLQWCKFHQQLISVRPYLASIFYFLFASTTYVDLNAGSLGEIGWARETHPSLFNSAGGGWFEFSREIGWVREAHPSLFYSAGIGWRGELIRHCCYALPAISRHVQESFVGLCSCVLFYLNLLFQIHWYVFLFLLYFVLLRLPCTCVF